MEGQLPSLAAELTRQAYVDSIEIDPTMRTPPSRTMQELTEKARRSLATALTSCRCRQSSSVSSTSY